MVEPERRPDTVRLVIDLQGAQTESRNRGIGRYCLSLAKSIAEQARDHQVLIALNGTFPDTISPIRTALAGAVAPSAIKVWKAPAPIRYCDPDSADRRTCAALIREAFIGSLNPDVVHIPSFFEGFADDAVTSIDQLGLGVPTVVTLHDLIPLLHQTDYLDPNPSYRQYYLGALDEFTRAHHWLTDSVSSGVEAQTALGLPAGHMTCVPLACNEEIFTPLALKRDEARGFLSPFGIHRPFLLYTGGCDPRKNLPRLVRAFAALPRSLRTTHQLVMVGKMPTGNVAALRAVAGDAGLRDDDLVFTQYVSDEALALFYNLCAAFVFPSIHEGFGLPVLEAMSCGAPVIAADATSLPEVMAIPEAMFDPTDSAAITDAMVRVLTDSDFADSVSRQGLSRARQFTWSLAGAKALEAFERVAAEQRSNPRPPTSQEGIISELIRVLPARVPRKPDQASLKELAAAISDISRSDAPRQLLVDISELSQRDSRTGIQRVTRSILHQLLESPPAGFVVRPIYATQDVQGYRYANTFTAKFRGLSAVTEDAAIEYGPGDEFLGLDLQHQVVCAQERILDAMHRAGVRITFVVYDLLPIQFPDFFPPGMDRVHADWLRTIVRFDAVACISKTVATEVRDWLAAHDVQVRSEFSIQWWHIGADVESSVPTFGMPSNADAVLRELAGRPTFLAVGTIEPRKGQAQVLSAFDLLWEQGEDVNLVIVGKAGWMTEQLTARMLAHKEAGRRFHWLNGTSDEYLDQVYQRADCLIAASYGEGFGLPLVEAAIKGIPALARDIPVFREVAGDGALYFSGLAPADLATGVNEWLRLQSSGNVPRANSPHVLTWRESTELLVDLVTRGMTKGEACKMV